MNRFSVILVITFSLSTCTVWKAIPLGTCYAAIFDNGRNGYGLELDHVDSTFSWRVDVGLIINDTLLGTFKIDKRKLLLTPKQGELILSSKSRVDDSSFVYTVFYGDTKDTMKYVMATTDHVIDTLLESGVIQAKPGEYINFRMLGYSDTSIEAKEPGTWNVYLYPNFRNPSIKSRRWKIKRNGLLNGKLFLAKCGE